MFQSTRPRGRTRLEACKLASLVIVSIHASSREDATCRRLLIVAAVAVSIHASSREDATIELIELLKVKKSFNPRVLAGGRDRLPCGVVVSDAVSIHASSREDATLAHFLIARLISFNPRVLAGGRDDYPAES